jgi:multidrug efflux pump
MSLYTLSIRRPVMAVVLSLVIIIFGVIAFGNLGVREFPSVDPAVITVNTSYAGANADVIESQITQVLEEKINSVPGLRTLTSTSREGRSTISAEFELGIDLETAANDVRDKVSNAIGELPPDVDPPSVAKADADSVPVVFASIKSDDPNRDLLELTAYIENVLAEQVQTIPGVAEIDTWGGRRYAMRLWLDPARLASYGLTPVDVRSVLAAENVELPSGRIEGRDVELTVRTKSRLVTVEDFNDMVLKQDEGQFVRLRDVGYAELGPENPRTILRRAGVPMVGMILRPQPGANQVEIVDEFYRRIAAIKKDLPKDLELAVSFDVSEYIRSSIEEVEETFVIAVVLVVAIIFAFLRDWRTTLIPALAIPVSLVGVFFILWISGFSINVLTLLGIVLAIGLVVDDAIVVLENIYAKIEKGMDPVRAGVEGTREIFFAVIATTIVLAAVFMPVLFLGGLTGRLFREFGVTIAGAVLISAFVALTLTPMLCTRLLKSHGERPNRLYDKTEPFFEWMIDAYRRSLAAFMPHRWLAIPILLATFGLSYWLAARTPSELAPLEDRSAFRVQATGPEGASYEYMDAYMQQLEELVTREVPEAEVIISSTASGFGNAGVNSGFVRVKLKPADQRERSQMQIADDLTPKLRQLTGARAFVQQDPTIGRGRRNLPLEFVIQATTFEKLREKLPAFLEKAAQDPTFAVTNVDLKFNKPEVQISLDRDRARDLGVSALDVGQTLSAGLSGQRFGYFLKDGKQYQVIGQLLRTNRDEPLDLTSLYVKSRTGNLVQLDSLVRLEETSSPPQIFHYNRFVSATISAGLARGKTMSDGIGTMERIAGEVLDESFTTALSGEARDFQESSSSLGFVFILALLLIYLILAAQFESFRDPLTILLTVPLALAGGLGALAWQGQSLNIFSQIGLIMLLGLVTKNGILIVEFANQRREEGDSILEAVQNAAVGRLRPVLMTSLATILGILPIALALGAGAESRKSMGIAVIGGLVLGTFLTLYVVPAMYSFLTSRVRQNLLAVDEYDKDAEDASPEQLPATSPAGG